MAKLISYIRFYVNSISSKSYFLSKIVPASVLFYFSVTDYLNFTYLIRLPMALLQMKATVFFYTICSSICLINAFWLKPVALFIWLYAEGELSICF
jgi:hypothetical protein